MKHTLNVNLFGGPGVGKSRTAAAIFDRLKMLGKKVDITQEFAKELVYAKDWFRLSDQLLVAGEQHHRMFRLLNNVDYAIHDSPFIMGMPYCCETKIPVVEFNSYLREQFNRYNNLNILLKRNEKANYEEYGRNQDLDGAINLDDSIAHLLIKNHIPFIIVDVNDSTVDNIIDLVVNDKYHE